MLRNLAKTVYKVSDFLSWQRNKSLVLSPSFQRRSVWPENAKSYLLDTVIRGLPIPIIFLRERTDLKTLEPIREVVDGQQRLRTLISFIEPESIKDFDPNRDAFVVKKSHNLEIAGKTFRQLTSELKMRILNYEFSVHILPSDTDDREVLQIFARMNSTGVKLNSQELRNAENYGVFKQLVYSLAYEQLSRWRQWSIFSETDIARMIEVEETSDFVLTMMRGLHGKSQRALDKIYKSYEEDFPFREETTRRFHTVMDIIDDTIGTNIKATAFSRKVLFNTLITFYYDLIFGLNSSLDVKIKPKPLPYAINSAIKEASDKIMHAEFSDDLAKVLRGATGNLESRKVRLKFLQDNLKNATV